MAEIHEFESTAGANDTPGALFPEGIIGSSVNNRLREEQAAHRKQWNDSQWFRFGDGSGPASITRTAGNQFTISSSTDLRPVYHVGRRLKIIGGSTGTVFTRITAVSFASPTTTVTVASSALQSESLAVYVGILSADSTSAVPAVLSSLEELIRVTLTDNGSGAGPFMDLRRIRSSPGPNDNLGQVRLVGRNSSGADVTYASIKAQTIAVGTNNETGRLFFSVRDGGTEVDAFTIEPGVQRVLSRATGGAAGPDLVLHRDSSAQPGNGSTGRVLWRHRNASGGNVDGGFLEAYLTANAAGGETMRVRAVTISGGSRSTKMDWGDNVIMTVPVQMQSDAQVQGSLDVDGTLNVDSASVLNNLAADSLTLAGDLQVGGEISGGLAITGEVQMGSALTVDGSITTGDGSLTVNRDGATAAVINRAQDGIVVAIQSGGVTQGTISVSGTTVSYGTFTGEHWAAFRNPADLSDPRLKTGTLLSSTGHQWKPDKPLPTVKVSDLRADPSIYGVYGGVTEQGVQVYALGSAYVRCIGAVYEGCLLQASELPGIAEAQPDVFVRSCTLGKVTIADDRTDERLVACTLMSG